MSKITYIKGNLLTSDELVIVHGCNSKGKFRSGFAKGVRELYPNCYLAYMDAFNSKGLELGSVVTYEDALTSKTIFNAITQDNYGYDGKTYVNYDAIYKALAVCDQLTKSGRLAMPMIGAGLGGGDWDEISKIIETTVVYNDPIVYVLE